MPGTTPRPRSVVTAPGPPPAPAWPRTGSPDPRTSPSAATTPSPPHRSRARRSAPAVPALGPGQLPGREGPTLDPAGGLQPIGRLTRQRRPVHRQPGLRPGLPRRPEHRALPRPGQTHHRRDCASPVTCATAARCCSLSIGIAAPRPPDPRPGTGGAVRIGQRLTPPPSRAPARSSPASSTAPAFHGSGREFSGAKRHQIRRGHHLPVHRLEVLRPIRVPVQGAGHVAPVKHALLRGNDRQHLARIVADQIGIALGHRGSSRVRVISSPRRSICVACTP